MPRGGISKLTPEVKSKILSLISKGVPQSLACYGAGITERTFFNWIAIGKDGGDNEYADLFQEIKKVESEFVSGLVSEIREMPKGWQALAWILERRFWNDFGRRQLIEVNTDGKIANITFNLPKHAKDVKGDLLTVDNAEAKDGKG
jgi:hypothetical protein